MKDTDSIFWLAPDTEGQTTAFLATSQESFANAPDSEILDDLLGGCYEGEIFYLAATDGYARAGSDKSLTISNHQQDLFSVSVDEEWLDVASQAQCFVWIVGLDAQNETFKSIAQTPASRLSSLMFDDALLTMIAVCVKSSASC